MCLACPATHFASRSPYFSLSQVKPHNRLLTRSKADVEMVRAMLEDPPREPGLADA
jgi:hypothetical protein